MISDERLEEIAMIIIANAGSARSSAFGALEAARKGDFSSAEELLQQSDTALRQAQDSHRELLQMDALGQVPKVNILLCHTQDHFMMATLARDLTSELVHVYRQIKK